MSRPIPALGAALAAALLLAPPPAAAETAGPAAPAGEAGVLDVVAGGNHSCALTPSRRVFCWGSGGSGEIGDGVGLPRWLPTEVTALGDGVLALAAGRSHNCAIAAGGRVFCWGRGDSGQIGDGGVTLRMLPAEVAALGDGVLAIAAGEHHTCALDRERRVYCWGLNDHGQLGDGTATSRPLPVRVQGLAAGSIAVTAGGYHSCALGAAGRAYCWGANGRGQLGDGTTTDSRLRRAVAGLGAGLREIEGGVDFTCAVTAAERLFCWGGNSHGQLGDGSTADRPLPGRVMRFDPGARGVAGGGLSGFDGHACALDADGRLYCWGRNVEGQVGDQTRDDRVLRSRVARLGDGVQKVAAGGLFGCAINSAGRLLCWGYNGFGQLGDGTNATRPVAAAVAGELHRR